MTWRDVLKVHPAADMFPMMSRDELIALGEDIKTNGMKAPIVVLATPVPGSPPTYEYELIDGRNRLDALELVGVDPVSQEKPPGHRRRGRSFHCGLDERLGNEEAQEYPAIRYDSLEDPWSYVVSANIHRRHLTGEQRRDLIAKLLKASPNKSDRQIAETVKVSPTTVGMVRAKMETAGDVSNLDTRTDTKGRAQPARKQPGKKKRPTVYIEHADGRREPFTVTEPLALFTACGMPINEAAEKITPTDAKPKAKSAPQPATSKRDTVLDEPDGEVDELRELKSLARLITENDRDGAIWLYSSISQHNWQMLECFADALCLELGGADDVAGDGLDIPPYLDRRRQP